MFKLFLCALLVGISYGTPALPASVLAPIIPQINQAIPANITQILPIPVTSVQQTVPLAGSQTCTATGTTTNSTTVQVQNVTITGITTTATGQTIITGVIGQVTQTTGVDVSGCMLTAQTGTVVTTATNVPFQVVGTAIPVIDSSGVLTLTNFSVSNATADVLAGNPTTAVNGLSGSFGQLTGPIGGLANATLGPAVGGTVGGVLNSLPTIRCANVAVVATGGTPNCTAGTAAAMSSTSAAPMMNGTSTTMAATPQGDGIRARATLNAQFLKIFVGIVALIVHGPLGGM